MNGKSDTVSQPVAESVFEPFFFYMRSCNGINCLRFDSRFDGIDGFLLGVQNGLIDSAECPVRFPDNHGPRYVGAVTVQLDTPVKENGLTFSEGPVSRDRMGQGTVGS